MISGMANSTQYPPSWLVNRWPDVQSEIEEKEDTPTHQEGSDLWVSSQGFGISPFRFLRISASKFILK